MKRHNEMEKDDAFTLVLDAASRHRMILSARGNHDHASAIGSALEQIRKYGLVSQDVVDEARRLVAAARTKARRFEKALREIGHHYPKDKIEGGDLVDLARNALDPEYPRPGALDSPSPNPEGK